MRDGVLAVNLLLHDTILVHANCCQNIQHALVHFVKPVHNKGHSDLLPVGETLLSVFAPERGGLGLADITDVHHNAVESTGVESLVLVVRGDCNEELSLAVVELGAKRPAVLGSEIVRVACRRGVPHVRELSRVVRTVDGLGCIADCSRDGVLCDEVAVGELDFADDTLLVCVALAASPLGIDRHGHNRCTAVVHAEGDACHVGRVGMHEGSVGHVVGARGAGNGIQIRVNGGAT
jgi:hypothetical protein